MRDFNMKKGFSPFGSGGRGERHLGSRGFRGGHSGRMRRGDMKVLVLWALKDISRHGYEIMDALEKERGGYRPSPGSIYPTLQMLEEGGFVSSEELDGKKVYTITDSGRELLKQRGEQRFEPGPEMQAGLNAREAMMKLGAAVRQAVHESNDESTKKVVEILDEARKKVYSILAS